MWDCSIFSTVLGTAPALRLPVAWPQAVECHRSWRRSSGSLPIRHSREAGRRPPRRVVQRPVRSRPAVRPVVRSAISWVAFWAAGSNSAPAGGGAGSGQPGGSLGDILGGILGGRSGAPPGGSAGGSLGEVLGGLLGGKVGGAQSGNVLSDALSNIVRDLQKSGHGAVAQSWVGTGPNQPLDPKELGAALGPDVISELSQHVGMEQEDLLVALSQHLPPLIDQLTPDGKLPSPPEASRMV